MNTLPAGTSGPIGVPNLDPKALEAGKLALVRDTTDAQALVITDRETYAAVGAVLIERLREYDAAKAFRDKVTKPVYSHWKYLCELLSVKPHEDLIKALKGAIGAYDLRELREKSEAAAQARELFAAQAPVAALTEALTIANAPEATAEGVGTRFVWKVKRIVLELLPEQFKCADMTAVQAEANRQGTSREEAPIIPGVVFEQEAQVSGKR